MTRLAAGVLVAVLAIAMQADADSWIRFVHVKRILGQVEIDRAKGDGYESAISYMPVSEGVRLKTAGESRAEVLFEDGSILWLSPKTEVSFSRLMLLSDGYRSSEVEIVKGGVRMKFRNRGDDRLRLSFADGRIDLEGSAEFFLHVDGTQAMLTVDKGKINVRQDGQIVTVKKKEIREFRLEPREEMAASRTGL